MTALPTRALPAEAALLPTCATMPARQEWQDLWLSLGSLGIALAAAFLLHRLMFAVLKRVFGHTATGLDDQVLRRVRLPLLLVFGVLAVRIVLPGLGLPAGISEPIQHAVSIAVIVAVAWVVVIALHGIAWLVLRGHDIHAADNLRARRVHTQVRILHRCLVGVVILVAVAAVLMTFPRMQQLGTSLLASAGIAGLVVGLAARPAVENLIAGLQLALTEPIRLDDVVIVGGEWGRIEEIRATYVVVRIWDERRLIVPFSKFLGEPFENWTRNSADILGTVFLHADYGVPVDAVRQQLQRIVHGSELWDGRVCVLHVTDATPSTVVLRALVSTSNASKCWELRCFVREKLLEFLQQQHPASLPRLRAEVHELRDATPRSR